MIGLLFDTQPVESAEINFSRDIRPILADKCFQCHGPDAARRQSGLRLDERDAAIAPADSGSAAIIPNQVEASGLVQRILSQDKDRVMPPSDSPKQLTQTDIGLISQWIAEGANYEGHWAFVPPKRPEIPPADTSFPDSWQHNPIDRFLQGGLKVAGLSPNPPAAKEALARRVALDLTGLPPSLMELDQFLADDSPQAYERLIDHFLASPHYGERMALTWLDLARYADSNGYQSDGSRDIWGYRDWVIQAFNDNKPFDQFTVEQLAGDMLPNATTEQIIATGFNRNHRLNGEGGRIVEEWFVETVIDRVETTGLTWLGLTLNCCRCHDHKYDPISQQEFYQLFAFFNSVEEDGVLAPAGKNGENTPPLLAMKTKAHQAEIERLESQIASLETELHSAKEKLPALAEAWAMQQRDLPSDKLSIWQQMEPTEVSSVGGATLTIQEDRSFLASGKNPTNDSYVLSLPAVEMSLSGVLLEVLPDASLPNQSLGRGFNGNFVMTDFTVEILGGSLKKPRPVKLVRAEADFAQEGWPASTVLENTSKSQKPLKGWAVEGNNPERRLPRKIMFVAEKAIRIPKGSYIRIRLGNRSEFADHNVGRFRVSVTSLPVEQISLSADGLPAEVQAALAKDGSECTDSDRQAIEKYFASNVPNPVRELEATMARSRKSLSEFIENIPTTMVMKESQPRDAYLLIRGEYDKPGQKVFRGVPAVLPPLPADSRNDRLGLAKWIVTAENPLTARVWVNREWERFFGFGIVKTTENLGVQSEYPSNPQLLDWLAVEFMQPTLLPSIKEQAAHAWDIKALQKLILMSAAYRQSSQAPADKLESDPENRLVSRGPRFRLHGEFVRDSALAISGLLVGTIGGPSVRPYMPEGVWDETSKYGNLRNYRHDKDEGLYRRSLYTIWKRTAAPPSMLLFDAPNREVCTVKRSRTNTPLQALSLLNEITFVESARRLAERMISEGGQTVEQRLSYGFRLSLARYPNQKELAVMKTGLEADLQRFKQQPADAGKLGTFGEYKSRNEADITELAAYTLTANIILNLDEFVTRE